MYINRMKNGAVHLTTWYLCSRITYQSHNVKYVLFLMTA